MSLVKEWISLAQIVQEMGQMVHRAFMAKGIEYKTDIEPDLPLVYVDRTRIRQVLLNLVNNSLRFTDQGSMTVRLKKEDESLIVCVEDTGMGIPEENIVRLFEEFSQIKSESWRKREGAGLGLAISRRFIELHGGKMWVESEVGHGSRFYFSLPASPGKRIPSCFLVNGKNNTGRI
jgi:signal transduction histidine kinase